MSSAPEAQSQTRWALADLEHVGRCPACDGTGSHVLYSGLGDQVFGIAGGNWTIDRCIDCSSAFLSPRPAPHALSRAYGSAYYTHAPLPDDVMTILPHLSGIRLRSRNSYLNRRYGLSLAPTSAACLLHAYLDPRFRAAQARQIRHLKLPHPGATLLDIGCGSGSFVAFARTLGWSARGIDIDPGAVDAGLSAGLPLQVRTIGEEAAANAGTFDAVTMEHVLEHVPDPLAFLRTAGRLLKPGGQLWIATPNVRSAAHLRFGRHWKHLDPPRHVVIFTPQIVDKLLRLAGFHTIRTRASASGTIATYAHSSMIALGRSPVGAAPASRAAVIRGALAGLRSLVQPDVAEEIVRTAISTR